MPRLRPPLLAGAIAGLTLAALAGPARAQEGIIDLRGNYWRDRNTRVFAPEALIRKDFPTGTTVEGGYLLDAITSASMSAGVSTDQPFTELRSEASARLAQRFGPVSLSAQYRYSSESDYWAHTGGGSLVVDLLQKNLTLAGSYVYSHADVGMRRGNLGLIHVGTLDSHFAILSAVQVLSRWALLELSYEFNLLDGFQANPYRQVKVSGAPAYEVLPSHRERHAVAGAVRLTPIYRHGVLRYFTTYFKYRYYLDDWGVRAHAPELRLYLGLGPTELRLTSRVYTQNGADFFQANADGVAEYAVSVPYHDCPPGGGCYTGDAKLSPFTSVFTELRFLLELGFLDRPWNPLGHWLGGSTIAVSAGYYWNNNFAEKQFGNAWVGGLELVLPL